MKLAHCVPLMGILLFIITFSGCDPENMNPNLPRVITSTPLTITSNGAMAGGIVIYSGAAEVSERGIFLGTVPNPASTGTRMSLGSGLGEFTTALSCLKQMTTYYITAYAENSYGISFGQEISFVTSANEIFTDPRDGQTYKTVTIGNQVWMAENMNYYVGIDSYCYDYIESNCDNYGKLYTFVGALQAVPPGWHMPTKEEFEILLSNYASPAEAYQELLPEGCSGFDSKFGGFYNHDGTFVYLDRYADYWSSTDAGGDWTWILDLNVPGGEATMGPDREYRGFSLRCIKDSQSMQ